MTENFDLPNQITNGGFDDTMQIDIPEMQTGEVEFLTNSMTLNDNNSQIELQPPTDFAQNATEYIPQKSVVFQKKSLPRTSSLPHYSSVYTSLNFEKSQKSKQPSLPSESLSASLSSKQDLNRKIPIDSVSLSSTTQSSLMTPLSQSMESLDRTTNKTCCSKFRWFCCNCWCDFEHTVFEATRQTNQGITKATSECHRWYENYWHNNCLTPKQSDL